MFKKHSCFNEKPSNVRCHAEIWECQLYLTVFYCFDFNIFTIFNSQNLFICVFFILFTHLFYSVGVEMKWNTIMNHENESSGIPLVTMLYTKFVNGLSALAVFYLTSVFNLSGKFSVCFTGSQQPTAALYMWV